MVVYKGLRRARTIDLAAGQAVGLFEFTAGCQEVYDVQLLPGVRRPMLLNREKAATRDAFPASGFAYWLRSSNAVADPHSVEPGSGSAGGAVG